RRDPRVRPQIPRLKRTIKRAAPPRPSRINRATLSIAQMRTPPINKRQDRPIIEQHATMPLATGTLAINARKLYQDRRRDSATRDGKGADASELDRPCCLIMESSRCIKPKPNDARRLSPPHRHDLPRIPLTPHSDDPGRSHPCGSGSSR